MGTRRMMATGIAAAVVALGGAGAIATADAMNGPPSDAPDVPGVTDTPEPGDTPDQADAPDAPGVPDLPEPGDTPDSIPPQTVPTR